MSWTQYTPYGSTAPSASPVPLASSYDPPLAPIESAPAETLNALSVSQLAPILSAAQQRFRFLPLVCFLSIALLGLSFNLGNQLLVSITTAFGAVFTVLAVFVDRYRRSVRITYELESEVAAVAKILKEAFSELESCRAVWNVSAKGNTSDWKRNAGATSLNIRKEIRPKFMRPACLRGKVKFPALKSQTQELYFLPDAMLVVRRGSVAALTYQEFDYSNRLIRFIEDGYVPADASVIGSTWRFVNKNGGPDRRFNSNKQLSICAYGEMEFGSKSGLNCVIQYSNSSAGDKFSKIMEILQRPESRIDSKPITNVREAKKSAAIIFGMCFVVLGGSLAALALTSERSESRLPLSSVGTPANLSSPIGAQERNSAPQSRPPQSVPKNVASPAVESKSKGASSDGQIKRREGVAVEPLPSRIPSVAQCLSIEDVDERVDCLEGAHAARAQ